MASANISNNFTIVGRIVYLKGGGAILKKSSLNYCTILFSSVQHFEDAGYDK